MRLGMNVPSSLLAVTPALALVFACSSDDPGNDGRTNVPATGTSDAGVDDGGGGDGAVDPSGGRDDLAASCYASCQNSAFSCQTKVPGSPVLVRSAQVQLGGEGCSGATKDPGGDLALTIDCPAATVCVADAPGGAATTCVKGTFSAFSFAYSTTICTRVAD